MPLKGQTSTDGCPYLTKTKQHMERHLRAFHGSPRFVCTHVGCERSYIEQYALNEHRRLKHEGVKLVCDQCGKEFTSRAGLHDHKNTYHTKNLPYKCAQCDKQFRSLNFYEVHVSAHEGITLYKCDKCMKNFKYKQSLTIHEKICKSLTPGIKCEICDSVFTRSSFMKEHVRSKHGAVIFKCKTCNRPYQWRSSLFRHEKMCTNFS